MECKKTLRKQPMALLPIWIAVLLIAVPITAAAEDDAKHALVVGRINDNPGKNHAPTKAVADYLAAQLKDVGIEEGRILFTNDMDQMVEDFKQGRVDIICETTLTSARLIAEAGAELLVKANRKREGFQRAVFFAHKDSGISSLADLRGRIIAFEDNTSTAGYTIPAAVILSHGLELVRLNSPRQPPPPGTIGYVFSGSELTSALMVHKNVVHAGVFSKADLDTERSMPKELRGDIKVFYETIDFPRSLILVRKNLPSVVKERLKQVLFAMPADPHAASLLVKYHLITKFEAIGDADLRGIAEGQRLEKIARTQLK